MPEARRSERLKSLLRARIVFNSGNSTIECLIRNVSAHGMRLQLAESLSVPGEFDQKSRIRAAATAPALSGAATG
jgi:hypothetical protein